MVIPEWLKGLIQRRAGPIETSRVLGRVLRAMLFVPLGGSRYSQSVCSPAMVEALGQTRRRSHISDHLGTLFFFAVDARPRLMVELGTNTGESTCALLAAASVTDATLLSIDIKDCGQLDLPFKERWHFVQSEDVEFGKNGFVKWCQDRSIEPRIDLLFVDTTHFYDQTQKEIEAWLPHLSAQATLIFHDTNMGTGPYARLDGSAGYGYDNQRGVVRAIEELLGRRYDERSFFSDFARGHIVMHHPHCGGLTVMKRVQ